MSNSRRTARAGAAALCALALGLGAVPLAGAAFDDPLAVITPVAEPPAEKKPPPEGDLEAPCGAAVDENGNFLLSDYYRNLVNVFSPALAIKAPFGFLGQITNVDPLDGPCGLALDADGSLYVNGYHRNVIKYDPSFTASTVIAGQGVDGTHPTGIAVNQAAGGLLFVDQRTQIGVYSAAGTLLRVLGATTLGDGYGMAVSEYPGSNGLLYVADAATETVKVYDPAPLVPGAGPLAEIDGSQTPLGHFVSLRDAAIAIDRASGEVYVADNLQPQFTERPETVIHVFDATGEYQGRLKHSVANGLPPGLAVDNSPQSTQGRVFVTSGNTAAASVYVYGPGAASSAAVPLPAPLQAPAGAPVPESTTATAALANAPAGAEAPAPAAPAAADPAPAAAKSPPGRRGARKAQKRQRSKHSAQRARARR